MNVLIMANQVKVNTEAIKTWPNNHHIIYAIPQINNVTMAHTAWVSADEETWTGPFQEPMYT